MRTVIMDAFEAKPILEETIKDMLEAYQSMSLKNSNDERLPKMRMKINSLEESYKRLFGTYFLGLLK